MKIATKHLTKTQVELTVTLDPVDLEPARQRAISLLASKTKLPGFRQGKAPASIVEKHLDPNELSSQTLDLAVRHAIPIAFEKQSLRPVAMPEVTVTKYIPGDTAEFVATAEILPPVKLGPYHGLNAKLTTPKITNIDITNVLSNIAKSFAEKSAVKRKAKASDEVIIDFVGKIGDTIFEGGSAKNFKLILGDGKFIPGFEDSIIGHASGDSFTTNLTFPKDYQNKDLAGAKATFDILLKQVNAVTPPKIDDALAQKCGPFKTLKDLKDDIRANLEEQARRQSLEKYKDALVDDLVKKSVVAAPKVMIKDQLRQTDDEDLATKRVKAALVLQQLAKHLNISATDAEVESKLDGLKTHYQSNSEALKSLSDPRVPGDIRNRLIIEKTLDKLVELNQ
jgi:trigger factor